MTSTDLAAYVTVAAGYAISLAAMWWYLGRRREHKS